MVQLATEGQPTASPQRHQVVSGARVGRWTVVNADSSPDRKVLCRCECGTEKRIYRASLETSGSMSCGCSRKDYVRYKDLSGQKFGCVTVLSHAGTRGGSSLWICVCECGETMTLTASNLKPGTRASCSCKGVRKDASIPLGTRFGIWTTIEPSVVGQIKVRCRCECGTLSDIAKSSLKCGDSKSCGCLKAELIHLTAVFKHGLKHMHAHEYGVWCGMKSRCFDPNQPYYKRYGGRGITVCERWIDSFTNFLGDMGPAPEGHTIERVDNNGNYSPDNCKWATKSEQARNRRSTVVVEFKGERRKLIELVEESGFPYLVAYKRIKRGWTAEQAVSIPVGTRRHQ